MTDDRERAETYFAPAERAPRDELEAARRALLADPLAMALLDSIPDLAMVLNHQRQIVVVNHRVLEALGVDSATEVLGLRPGELVDCIHAEEGPGGCGTSRNCDVCPAVNTILRCIETGETVADECRIRTGRETDGGALDLYVVATPLRARDLPLIALTMRDISAEKRRGVLERTFFHDVLNTVAALRAVSELLDYSAGDPEEEEEFKRDLRRIGLQLSDEIVAQRQLLAAERGELKLQRAIAPVGEVLGSVFELYRHHTLARGRTLSVGRVPDVDLETDLTLLRRVLGNLVKNALEATPEGGEVTMEALADGDWVIFEVRNPGVMPEEVQKQIFQRSFSTKGEPGRGIGTHSVKLLGERYLGGKVSFESAAPDGTVFRVALPRELGADS
ncbi:MAG: GHKL domain-containing protein [Armatimonadetes bacterium]|nr:GHKL domain-containing protein [Armatimonadota bacterium]